MSLSTARVAGIVPLAQLETASLSTARATCRKNEKKTGQKVCSQSARYPLLVRRLVIKVSLCEMSFGPVGPCYNSGWRRSYLVIKSSLREMSLGPAVPQTGDCSQGLPACRIPVADKGPRAQLADNLPSLVGNQMKGLTMVASHCA